MKYSKIFKILIMSAFVVALLLLVKSNVTFSHEPRIEGATSNLTLEINSDLVQTLYSKLTLLEDSIMSDKYKYLYFKMDSNEKKLSPEEMLYVTIEDMYSKEKLETVNEDDIEKTTVESKTILEEANKIFKDTELNPKNMSFSVSSNCGLVSYLYTGENYELGFKKCDSKEEINKSKLISAQKQGNYIILRIKSFYVTYKKNKKKEGKYIAYNYNSDESLGEFTESELDEKLEKIILDDRVEDYDFYFELQGDDYNLSKIAKTN